MRVAVFEGDAVQAKGACQTLSAAGHVCHAFTDWRLFVNQLRGETFDLILLDWKSAEMPGEDSVMWIRKNFSENVPILCLTTLQDESDVARILNQGADDYVAKTAPSEVLLAHVGSLLRRAYRFRPSASREVFDDFEFDRSTVCVRVHGKVISLTEKEFALALLFFRQLGQTLSRAHILESIWKRVTDVPSRTMDTHVSTLRAKLGLRPDNGFRLAPVYGHGYRLERVELVPAQQRIEAPVPDARDTAPAEAPPAPISLAPTARAAAGWAGHSDQHSYA